MGNGAFMCCNLASVSLPPSVRKLAAYAFRYNYGLRSVELSEGLEEIGKECFAETALESILLPMSLRCIGEGAFYKCTMLSKVASEDFRNLRKVGEWAFGETALRPRHVRFPDDTDVAKTAFKRRYEM